MIILTEEARRDLQVLAKRWVAWPWIERHCLDGVVLADGTKSVQVSVVSTMNPPPRTSDDFAEAAMVEEGARQCILTLVNALPGILHALDYADAIVKASDAARELRVAEVKAELDKVLDSFAE